MIRDIVFFKKSTAITYSHSEWQKEACILVIMEIINYKNIFFKHMSENKQQLYANVLSNFVLFPSYFQKYKSSKRYLLVKF